MPPAECVYVDDLPFNLTPARELGMAVIHHTDSEQTVERARTPAGNPAAGGRARLGAPRALTGAAAAGQSRLPRPYISLNMRPSMREVRAL